MQIIANHTFLTHVAPQGLRLDDRYREPRALNYQNDLRLCIPLPSNIHQLKKLLHTTLTLAPDDAPIYLYRRGGIWRFPLDPTPGTRSTATAALRHFCNLNGITDNTPGTLRLEPHEKDFLFGLLILNALVAASVDYDLFMVPDNQNFCLYLDHEDQIILQFRDEQTQSAIGTRFISSLQRLNIHTTPNTCPVSKN